MSLLGHLWGCPNFDDFEKMLVVARGQGNFRTIGIRMHRRTPPLDLCWSPHLWSQDQATRRDAHSRRGARLSALEVENLGGLATGEECLEKSYPRAEARWNLDQNRQTRVTLAKSIGEILSRLPACSSVSLATAGDAMAMATGMRVP